MLQKGMRLNDTYTLLEPIGEGGGGIVYKAYHERLKTYVVVKQIRDQVKGVLENRTEVDILKKLKSSYLPQVYDFLEIDGEVFTVMEYIPGKSLSQEMKERSFEPKEVLKWTYQLAETLSYLHGQKEKPIIHSDIKPANIMLTPEGNICLIDFNISLVFSGNDSRTVGISRGYSPPEQYRDFHTYYQSVSEDGPVNGKPSADTVPMREQAERKENLVTVPLNKGEFVTQLLKKEEFVTEKIDGENSKWTESDDKTPLMTETQRRVALLAGQGVDERSDIYSLGATIYHLLTGARPSLDFEKIPPITSYQNVQIGEAFALILTKMMALNPDDRYQNGGELLDALRNIYELDSEYKAFKRKRKLQKLLIGAAFLAGGALIGYGLFAMRQENTASYNRGVESAGELITAGEYDQAQDELDLAIFRAPKRITAYEKQTLRLYSMGAYEEAIAYGKDVINNITYVLEDSADESSLANIFYLMGNSYIELEDYVNAAECLKFAIIYDSNNGAYYRDYAVALARTGNVDDAETALSQAIALGLGQDTVYMTRGEIAYASGDYESAVSHLTDAVRSTQDSDLMSRAVVLCAKAYQALGNDYLDDEITLLESAESSMGTQSDLQVAEMLADAYTRKAQLGEEDSESYYEKALAKFQDLYEKGYSTRQMMENIAILYQEMGSYAEAMDMLLQMEEKYPDDYRTYKRLAYLEADYQQSLENSSRDYSEFYEYYLKAAELYTSSDTDNDSEMQMLEVMLQDLKDGGWLN